MDKLHHARIVHCVLFVVIILELTNVNVCSLFILKRLYVANVRYTKSPSLCSCIVAKTELSPGSQVKKKI